MALDNAVVTVTQGGKQAEKFVAHYPNIRTLRGFLNGQWNLAPFDGCFHGANRLGDVDASVEIGGKTLLVEFKSAKGGMNKGQVLKAIRQAKYSGIVTFFVFGKRDTPEAYLKIEPDAGSEDGFKNSGYIEATLEDVCEQFKQWHDWALENTHVESKSAEWACVSAVMHSLYNA